MPARTSRAGETLLRARAMISSRGNRHAAALRLAEVEWCAAKVAVFDRR